MIMDGKFICSDKYVSKDKDTGEIRASVTLTDTEKGGEFRMNVAGGSTPKEFVVGEPVEGAMIVQAKSTKIGIMFTFFGFKKPVTGK
jgi:hypothetical protein